jgi:hypothetical protein
MYNGNTDSLFGQRFVAHDHSITAAMIDIPVNQRRARRETRSPIAPPVKSLSRLPGYIGYSAANRQR